VNPVVVFGGYGTFGSLVAGELARAGIPITIAGRDGTRAEAFAHRLGPQHRSLAADVTRPESCRMALRGQAVAVHCAGPFGPFDATLLEACLEAGCHYADLADDRGSAALVRSYGERFRRRGLAAVYGCSSLPGISGALALAAARDSPSAPRRARVTLFIGNDNPKGPAAIRSLVRGLGKPIRAPQGVLRGGCGREVVPLPEPFGRRAVFHFQSPEYDLFPLLLGVRSVAVKVGFELRPANYACAALAILGRDYRDGTAAFFECLGKHFRRLGTSGGAVMAELFFADGTTRRGTVVARRDGQRMAALPCARVASAIASGTTTGGARTAYEFLGAGPLLEQLSAAGFEVRTFSGPA
jgi:hypothetical protein